MALPGLRIVELAPGAVIQDLGRPGYRRFGVTGGGAMDRFALAEGQAILGNDADAAALEMFATGGLFRSEGKLTLATSGAEMEVSVNGSRAPWRAAIELGNGDELRIGAALEGAYGYLHMVGGMDCPLVLGSKSSHSPSGLGQIPEPGQTLRPVLQYSHCRPRALDRPDYYSRRTIRILDGPQSGLFSERDRHALVSSQFTVSGRRNRMGMRLDCDGGAFDAVSGLTIASDAIVPGDIQVSGDGVATVLMADSQPVGGYPRIANVISADQHVLAQFPSGTVFRMERTETRLAVGELMALERDIRAMATRLRPVVRDPSDIGNLLGFSMISGVVRGDEGHED